ncbi:MAG: BACON domain-containing protein [Alistipes sp.]|nr:BACON domain-containing protein [Alistipes sp.]
MKKILILAAAVFALVGCAIEDRPEIYINDDSYTVSSQGGELIIPVTSTGIDNVVVRYQHDRDNWEIDSETGDMTPKQGWVKIVKVINDYQPTRDLALWTSGIQIEVEPNTTGVERTAHITAYSFTKEDTVTIKQGF